MSEETQEIEIPLSGQTIDYWIAQQQPASVRDEAIQNVLDRWSDEDG